MASMLVTNVSLLLKSSSTPKSTPPISLLPFPRLSITSFNNHPSMFVVVSTK